MRYEAHPQQTIVVGGAVNVVWRVEAPFFAEPYRGPKPSKQGMDYWPYR
jgi:hypothetical protein